MFSPTLFNKNLKSNYKLILIFMGVLAMYFSIIAHMYDPDDLDIINQLSSLKLSPELLEAFGFTLADTTLTGFISSYFYGLLMLAFPMICYIILCNSLVAKLVDRGSMSNLLSTPTSRMKISMTQCIFALLSITAIITFVTVWGIILCEIKFEGMLDIGAFIKLNLGALLVHFAISGICFFSSCFFNESKSSLMIGAGVPIAFLLFQMLSNANEDIPALKYLTLFSLFKPADIIHGEAVLPQMISLALCGAILYAAGIMVFNKKDLPI